MTSPLRSLSVLALGLALAPAASASGFLLREQSAAGLGNAFAGASAGSQDLSSMFWNPAVLPVFGGREVSLGGSWIGIHMDLTGASASRSPVFQPADRPIAGGGPDLPNAVSQPILPALYLSWPVTDRVYLGFSVNVPFGLVTEYPADFIGRYHALKTDLKTYDFAPSVAYKADGGWTFGAAFVARKAEATLSSAVDFGAIGNALGLPGFVPGARDAVSTLKGDCWAYGWKAGFTWQATPDLRIGAGYQAKATLKVKGNVTYSAVPAPLDTTFVNAPGAADVHLPATASAGFTWDLSPAFSLQGEGAWTGWSDFRELRVRFGSAQPDSVTNESWKDTFFVSLGGIWKAAPGWAVKAGLAYDRSPVDDRHRTPRIPDANRTWASAGVSWQASPAITWDLGLTRIFGQRSRLALTSGVDPAGPDFYRGNLSGAYDVGATIVALSGRFRF
ncbi:OmpP1/FadL family transporter [Mesoterricola sediminis]|nr:outer membrane protein transport protein [Mesoterricola sediminis]